MMSQMSKVLDELVPVKEIFVTVSGRSSTSSIDQTQSIFDLKTTIVQIFEMDPMECYEFMILYYSGKLLQDEWSAYSALDDKVDVHCFFKLLGGGKRARASEATVHTKVELQKQLNDSIVLLKQYSSPFAKDVLEEVEKHQKKLQESGEKAIFLALLKLDPEDLKELCTSSSNNVTSRMQMITNLLMKAHFDKLEQNRKELKQAEQTLITMVNLAMHSCYNQGGNMSWKSFEADVVKALLHKPEETQSQSTESPCTIQ